MSSVYISITAITLLVVVYAATRGDSPERFCAAIIAGEAVIDLALQVTIGPRSFRDFDASRMLIDVISASLFIAVALRANRLYPLGIAAAQLVAVIGSVAVLLSDDGWSQAFWAMTQLPLLLQLVLLAGGTFAHRYRFARIGAYNGWSPRMNETRQFA